MQFIEAIDHLAGAIVGALNRLFGWDYTKNTEHYVYELELDLGDGATAIAVGDRVQGSLRFTQDSDFIATRVNLVARRFAAATAVEIGTVETMTTQFGEDPAAGDLPDPGVDILLTDAGKDRQLSNQAVDAFGAYGSHGGLPGILARPRLFKRNTNLSVELTARKAGEAAADRIRFRLQLIGWKVYDLKSLDLTQRRG